MNIDPFAEAKRLVSAQDAAHFYGLAFSTDGKRCICPFHADHKPSMGFYKDGTRYHCFACGADGSAVDMVMGLYGLDATHALHRLISDFRLPISVGKPQSEQERRQAQDAQRKRQRVAMVDDALANWIDRTANRLACIYQTGHLALMRMQEPADFDRLTVEDIRAIQAMPEIDWMLDELTSNDIDRILGVLRTYGKEPLHGNKNE